MAVADFLESVGQSVAGGLEKAGKVAGALAAPVGKAVATEEAGYAPQIAAENRQHQQSMEDAAIGAKAKVLESQLGQLQSSAPLFKADGSVMSPQERSAALGQLTDQYTQLYSHPRHAATLMEKLRQAVHPNGAVAGVGGAGNPAKAMGGFTAAPPPGYDDQQAAQQKEKDFQQQLQFFDKTIAPHLPADQLHDKRNAFIDHLAGIKEPAAEKPPKEDKIDAAGIFNAESGKYYTSDMLESGNAPKELIDRWGSQKKAEKEKKEAADKEEEKKDKEREKLQAEREAREDARTRERDDHAEHMAEFREQLTAYGSLDKEANQKEEAFKSAQKAIQAGSTPSSDQELIYSWVRSNVQGAGRMTQTEFTQAGKLGALDQRAQNWFNMTVKGKLNPEIEQMMFQDIKRGAETAREEAESKKPDQLKREDAAKKPKKGGVANQLKPPAAAPGGQPAGATHIKKYQGKEYWVDSQGNNLGEKQ